MEAEGEIGGEVGLETEEGELVEGEQVIGSDEGGDFLS